jgi:enoyl-CoA hydratase/carnithine racemase
MTLADPDRHNALNHAAISDAMSALDEVQTTDARVLVLTGEGRTFCAGARLDNLGAGGMAENPFTPLCERLDGFALPTIAALQGSVFGAGVELALSCDFRIGVVGMKAAVPAAELGIHYTREGIARTVRKLGSQVARRVFLLAERFDDVELQAAGFLDHCVAKSAFDGAVSVQAQRLASLAPLAVQGMKRSISAAELGLTDPDAVDRIATCFASVDHAEGLSAKKEKRPPVFLGR